MKLIAYRVNINKGRKKGVPGLNIERMLFISVISLFIIMVLVQAALLNPAIRTSLAIDDKLEGTPLGTEEYLYKEAVIILQVEGTPDYSNIKVLVNGEEEASFSTSSIELDVKDGDVVEIDGTCEKDKFEVIVSSADSSVAKECIGKRVTVDSNVKKLLRVRID